MYPWNYLLGCQGGYLDILELLIAHNADINAQSQVSRNRYRHCLSLYPFVFPSPYIFLSFFFPTGCHSFFPSEWLSSFISSFLSYLFICLSLCFCLSFSRSLYKLVNAGGRVPADGGRPGRIRGPGEAPHQGTGIKRTDQIFGLLLHVATEQVV